MSRRVNYSLDIADLVDMKMASMPFSWSVSKNVVLPTSLNRKESFRFR